MTCKFCFGSLEKDFWRAYMFRLKGKEQEEIALTIGNEPYSWGVVWIEVMGHSDMAKKMLEKLKAEEKI
jgi:hypothetical protein